MQMTLIDTRINFISQINILINVAPDSLAPSVNLTCTFIIIWRTCGRQLGVSRCFEYFFLIGAKLSRHF